MRGAVLFIPLIQTLASDIASGPEALPRRTATAIRSSLTQPQHPNIWNVPREGHQRIAHGNERTGCARNNIKLKDLIGRGQHGTIMAVCSVANTTPSMSLRKLVHNSENECWSGCRATETADGSAERRALPKPARRALPAPHAPHPTPEGSATPSRARKDTFVLVFATVSRVTGNTLETVGSSLHNRLGP